ncbi:hypothetical protein Q5741_03795 [Paenibacillus sp. JX-17]|uniref:Uncharacterized protein n=1 Tax=Paenibacillus lacisoli TaxID=3064525 RepID=A0ABT9CC28_9BACL|nr:hypothetical protein [Paenibacillus sp. JX-17]MDO7905532.1 hypothetical protein [Paenibacillus sp. JX-17]
MNITKEIEEILLPLFFEHNFTEYKKTAGTWDFSRKMDGYYDHIMLDTSVRYKNAIRCSYSNGTTFNNSALLLGQLEEWQFYDSVDSLREKLQLIGDITINYALKWFKDNAPKKARAQNFLDITWEPVIKEFIARNNIDLFSSNSVDILDHLLELNPNENDIMVISYCYGEIIRNNFGADWVYDEFGEPIVNNIGGKVGYKRRPFSITNIVLKDSSTSLREYFDIIHGLVEKFRKK